MLSALVASAFSGWAILLLPQTDFTSSYTQRIPYRSLYPHVSTIFSWRSASLLYEWYCHLLLERLV